MSAPDLRYLADHPEAVATLARWHHAEWGDLNPGSTVQTVARELRNHGRDQVPSTWIAFQDGRLVGSASLVTDDMDSHPELTPWLASVYVVPEARRRGVGTALVRRVLAAVHGLGLAEAYLFTFDREEFYQRLGWRTLDRTVYRSRPVYVMGYRPEAPGPC